MKYAPGSFSKNFAWHGTGLRKLHGAIRAGYNDTLEPAERQRFRDSSRLDTSLSLIPINFFLHNQSGKMSVDELVFQAIARPHSIRFDRLGLFAFHLNRVGGGDRIVERPAMWANEFVREELWSRGVWRSNSLQDIQIDRFLADRMSAERNVRVKCRNNYRHMFELCEYWPPTLPLINSQAEQWIASAFFLAWDRHTLDSGAEDKKDLLALITADELYKLIGTTHDYATERARNLVEIYIDVGGLARFHNAKNIADYTISHRSKRTTKLPKESGLEWLEQEESDKIIERRLVERHEQIRNRKKAVTLKLRYDNTCIFCGTKLQVSEDRQYSEAAHIRGLGAPHNGPDKFSNMLVLCPNHHLQFDRGILRLRKVGSKYQIQSKSKEDPLNGKVIILRHDIDDDCVDWHYKWFGSKRS